MRGGYLQQRGGGTGGTGGGGSLPAGGTPGQVLTKTGAGDGEAAWATPHYVPPGGAKGQVLAKASGVDYDTKWDDTIEYTPEAEIRAHSMSISGAFALEATKYAFQRREGGLSVWALPAGELQSVRVKCIKKDSGAEQPTVRLTVNGNAVGPVLSVDDAVWTSESFSGFFLKEGDELGIEVVTTGTNKDATDLNMTVTVLMRDPEGGDPVSVVRLSPPSLSIPAGTEAHIEVIWTPADAKDRTGDWGIDNPGLAEIVPVTDAPRPSMVGNALGCRVIAGSEEGTAVLTFTTTDGGLVVTATVEITAAIPVIPVQDVRASPASLTVAPSSEAVASLIWLPPDATNRKGRWEVEHPELASVVPLEDATGNATGCRVTTNATEGLTSVIFYPEDTNAAPVTVLLTIAAVPAVPVEGVSASPSVMNVTYGTKRNINLSWNPINATNRAGGWTIDDPSVATLRPLLDLAGMATGCEVTAGAADGTAKVRFTSADGGFVSETTLTVSATPTVPVNNVFISPGALSLSLNTTAYVSLVWNPTNASDRTGTWSADNPEMFDFEPVRDAYGNDVGCRIMTKALEGETMLRFASEDGAVETSVALKISTAQPVPVSGLSLTPSTIQLATGGASAEINTLWTPANASDKSGAWTVDDPSIVDLEPTSTGCKVTSKDVEGSAVVTFTSADGSFAQSVNVTVSATVLPVAVEGVSLDPAEIAIDNGEVIEIAVNWTPEYADNRSGSITIEDL